MKIDRFDVNQTIFYAFQHVSIETNQKPNIIEPNWMIRKIVTVVEKGAKIDDLFEKNVIGRKEKINKVTESNKLVLLVDIQN